MSEFVTVATFTSPWEAHITKGLLESEGIPVFIAHEHHIWANWMLSNALGGVKLQVTIENAKYAYEVLNSTKSGEYESVLKQQHPDTQENVCPQCGSSKFKSSFPIGTIILLICTLGLVGVIFPPRRENHSCLECGRKWNY